jgi:hypothetical protein
MDKCADELSATYPKNSGHLSWHAEQMNERYRQINIAPLGNKEIRQLFKTVSEA